MEIRKNDIAGIVDELSGLAFEDSLLYTQKEREFFEDRYYDLLSFIPEIKKNDVGLEVGLAGGVLAFLLKRFIKVENLYALEHPDTSSQYSKAFLKKLKENKILLKPTDLYNGRFPWPNNFFNFIIFSEVIEHLIPAYVPLILREMKRILKKDGWILITTPNIASLLKRINLLFGKNPIEFDLRFHQMATFGHIREYTMRELISIAEEEKLKIIKKNYSMLDKKRNVFTRIEFISSKVFSSLGNNIQILIQNT